MSHFNKGLFGMSYFPRRTHLWNLVFLVALAFVLHTNLKARRLSSRSLDGLEKFALPALRGDEDEEFKEQLLKRDRKQILLEDFRKTQHIWRDKTMSAAEIAERYGIILTPGPACVNQVTKVGWIPCVECGTWDGDYGKIPRVIVQTWETEELSKDLCGDVITWSQVNPDYDYLLFNADSRRRMIELEYGQQILDSFDCINVGAAKADVWRLMYIYLFGGIYFDLDSTPKSEYPFRTWGFGNHSVVADSDYGNQWGMIYTPKHPIIRDALFNTLSNLADRVQGMTPALSFVEFTNAFHDHNEYSKMPGWGESMGGRVTFVSWNAKKEMLKHEEHWDQKPQLWRC